MKTTLVVLSTLLVLNGAHAQFGRGERFILSHIVLLFKFQSHHRTADTGHLGFLV